MTDDNPSGIRVRLRHVRQAGLCASGVRRWFAPHGRERLAVFCRAGLPVEWAETLDDPFAKRLAALARAEVANG